MRPQAMRDRLLSLYEEWDKSHQSSPHLPKVFRFYVLRQDRSLYAALMQNPRILGELPRNIQRDWKWKSGKLIGLETLKKYSTLLTARYLALPHKATFQQFLDNILEEYTTEQELKEFLNVQQ